MPPIYPPPISVECPPHATKWAYAAVLVGYTEPLSAAPAFYPYTAYLDAQEQTPPLPRDLAPGLRWTLGAAACCAPTAGASTKLELIPGREPDSPHWWLAYANSTTGGCFVL